MSNKKGQEEIVGFALIMVIVVVIFLVILGITIRNGGGGTMQESREIYHFLESIMVYTTPCSVSAGGEAKDVGELISECYSNPSESCTSGENVCSVLNNTVSEAIRIGENVGADRNVKGYNFIIKVGENELLRVSRGACGNNIRKSDLPLAGATETETSSLELCY